MDGDLTLNGTNLNAASDLKGMFSCCIRKDQWDWYGVFTAEPGTDHILT